MPEKQHEAVGSLSGMAGGVLAGAAVGTALLPIVGTFVGALAGGVLGSEIGRSIGGAVLDALSPAEANVPAAPAPASLTDQLERLGRLREQGVINDQEFVAAKAKILGV